MQLNQTTKKQLDTRIAERFHCNAENVGRDKNGCAQPEPYAYYLLHTTLFTRTLCT